MKRLLVSLLLLLTMACDNVAPITAMSFNIYWDNPNDPENAWSLRRADVIAMIERHAPHVIGFQETQEQQLRDLMNLLPNRYGGQVLPTREGVYDSLIIWDRTRFKLLNTDHFWLGPHPGLATTWKPLPEEEGSWYTKRSATCVDLLDRQTQVVSTFCNTHFDAIPSLGERAAELIVERVASVSPRLVLLGDFNALPHKADAWPVIPAWTKNDVNRAYEVFSNAGMIDAFKHMYPTYSGGSICAWGDSMPSYGADTRVDWVLTKGFDILDAQQDVTRRSDGRPISDHAAQIAVLAPSR